MSRRTVVALLAASQLFPGAAAFAQLSCAPHETVADFLGRNFAESPVAFGVTGQGLLVQVYASADGSTWTIVVTRPPGQACIMASGTDWTDMPADLMPLQPDAMLGGPL